MLLTVILRLLKSVRGLRKIGAVLKGRVKCSKIVGKLWFLFFKNTGPDARRVR